MKRKLTVIIVDDEQSAIDHALTVIRPFIDLIVKGIFTDPVAALKFLQKNHVDFVLLDVEMPLVDGLAFAVQLPKEIKVIYCTAHREYAVDAFNGEAVDYLLKPLQRERFAKALDRMKAALMIAEQAKTPVKDDYYYFMVKGPVKFYRTRIIFDEIVYIEAGGDHTHFFLISDLRAENKRLLDERRRQEEEKLAGKTVLKKPAAGYEGMITLMTLQEVNEVVNGSTLMQIHKSIILNTDYLRHYRAKRVELVALQAITLPTGLRANYPEFFEWLDNHNGPNS